MSFKDLSKEELLEIAENFGVEVDARRKDETIIAEILDAGVTWDMYEQSIAAAQQQAEFELDEDDEPEVVIPVAKKPEFKTKANEYLLKMERQNPRFEIRGYKFTREHPYAAVAEADVNFIMANVEGFRIATPSEVQEFYGR